MRLAIAAWRRYLGLILLFGFIAASMFFSLASDTTVPEHYDITNHLAGILQAKMAFLEGQFPLRVTPLINQGWRYPLYQFYSPSSYMLTGLIYDWLTPSSPLLAYKIASWCALIAGGIYMYRLALWFVGSAPAAILAGIVYITSPYFIITINMIGAFNETLALGILPAVLYYVLNTYEHPSDCRTILLSSLTWYLLATFHLLTFICTSLLVAIILLLVTALDVKKWKNLMAAGSGYAFACLLAVWYLAPIAWLGKYFEIALTFVSSNFYYDRPSLLDLLSPVLKTSAYIPERAVSSITTTHPIIGIPILCAVGICMYALVQRSMTANKRADAWLLPLLAIFFILFLIIWSPLNFWQWLPPSFLVLQYSWRLLGQLSWIGALLFAWSLCWLFNNKLNDRHIILGILLLLIIVGTAAPSFVPPYIKFTSLEKNPVLIVNPTSYLIDGRKYRNFVNFYDSALVDPLMVTSTHIQSPDLTDPTADPLQYFLVLNKTSNIMPSMLHQTRNPVIVLQGNVPDDTPVKNLTLTANLNGHAYASRDLQHGQFDWRIPISRFRDTKMPLNLAFTVKDKTDSDRETSILTLPFNVMLSGFLNDERILDVYKMQQHCQQQKEETVCSIMVPASTVLMELPLYYYPKMLDIRLNGKPVRYYSVYYKSQLITAIAPVPGKVNVIKFRFRGLMWANLLSAAAWQLWLILLVYALFKTYLTKKNAQPHHEPLAG